MTNDKTPKLKQGHLVASAHIWDDNFNDWETAWEKRFKRQRFINFFDALPLITTDNYYSESFYCAPYANALIEIDIPDTTGTPTCILIAVEWSHDNANFYKYQNDFYGDLRWEDVGAPYKESFSLPVLAPYVRFRTISQGASAQAFFTLTLKCIFNG